MAGEGRKTHEERLHTDESLRTERHETDQAIAGSVAMKEAAADQLLARARKNADEVLGTARERADDVEPSVKAAVATERAEQDRIVEAERHAEDEVIRREREESARVLAALLPLERSNTDRYLLTERARSDDAVAHRDDFLGIVVHDLRNLLGAIVMTASLAESGPNMVRIQRYAARMNRLIGDLVDVVSIDAGKLSIRSEPADAGALVAEAVEVFRPAAAEKGISLLADVGAQPLPGALDHDRILQVLANLLSNAIKFTPPGGTIKVAAERAPEGTGVQLLVSDTGPGLSQASAETVFQRFWQGSKNDRRGLGLGLYISRLIVEAHGGRIWVESDRGRGSTFHVSIPARVASPENP